MGVSDQKSLMCQTCGHALEFHQIGTGNGVPVGEAYCDDRYSEPCSCMGFQMSCASNQEGVTWWVETYLGTLDEWVGVLGPYSSESSADRARQDRSEHGRLYRIVRKEPARTPTAGDFKIATAEKKVPLNLIPLRALKGAARVFQYGAKKYAKGNFLKAMIADGAFERYVGGLLRHLAATQDLDGLFADNGAELDDESGLPEIDHMICGLIMLRAILTKEGVLPEDPGEGKDPGTAS